MIATRYLLDTNILSHMIRDPHGPISRHLQVVSAEELSTSIIVACELRYGALRRGSTKISDRVNELLCNIQVLPLATNADYHYAEIRTALEQTGQMIGSNDLLIAAHARALALTLVTDNMREFKRVPDLKLENWLRPE